MLKAAAKGETVGAAVLAPEEDRALRAAFGRFGGRPEDRAAAAAVVRRYQQHGAGCWLLCDCRPDAERPPALVPVSQTHIRRHQDDRWPAHDVACDFHRDPAEQLVITASYTREAAERPLRLARAFTPATPTLERQFVAASHHAKRPGLARLLARLVTDAGLQTIGADWRPLSVQEQVKLIWAAAKGIELDFGVALPAFFCTSAPRFGEVAEKIEQADPARFRRGRPHGVLVARVVAFGAGALTFATGETMSVRGRIAVWAERTGPATRAEHGARAPYLAACLAGRPSPDEPVQLLAAYLHPCAAATHLMLVDSDLERRTLAQLRSVQAWLAKRKHVAVSIEKPLFDIAPEALISRPPCIPDYVLRAGGTGGAAVIVETMGFADEGYRVRKARLHPIMSAALGGAPVVPHDFHIPAHWTQEWRDNKFWRDARWALTGSQDRAVGSANEPAPEVAPVATHPAEYKAKADPVGAGPGLLRTGGPLR